MCLSLGKNLAKHVPMKSILVPTDFSEKSKSSILYALKLAKQLQMSITLLNVVDLYGFGISIHVPATLPPQMPQSVVEGAEREGKRLFSQLINELEDLDMREKPVIHFVQDRGVVVEQILEHSEEDDIGMVLLTGRQRINEISGITEYIIENTSKPLLILPAFAVFSPYRRILYASDYNPKDIQNIRAVIELLAGRSEAYVHVLHISEDMSAQEQERGEEFRKLIRQEFDYQRLDFATIPGENPVKVLAEFAKTTNADVVAMFKENIGFWQRVFTRSSTKRMVFGTGLPVLVFREQ